jgi:hypothetical protein
MSLHALPTVVQKLKGNRSTTAAPKKRKDDAGSLTQLRQTPALDPLSTRSAVPPSRGSCPPGGPCRPNCPRVMAASAGRVLCHPWAGRWDGRARGQLLATVVHAVAKYDRTSSRCSRPAYLRHTWVLTARRRPLFWRRQPAHPSRFTHASRRRALACFHGLARGPHALISREVESVGIRA